ncbi:Pentatricopeptide repeat-containing protein [Quillaja saponaria]|uniref:Pentatricopeptide repeat-containing protein n=1 Tax=Quillaja saponaria TaxID=32244 RepID=A0AAD7Q1N6_QUISA|nr:Pentatricopeptide repeat-containing protein [Quillaja saponaria]
MLYAKCGHISQSLSLFRISNDDSKNIVTWTSLISQLSHYKKSLQALTYFNRMRCSGIYPNPFTFSAILPACADTVVVSHGEQMHGLIWKHGYETDVFVGSALVDMYAKCSDMTSAERVFDEMPERSLVSWNSMIVGFLKNKLYDRAIGVFREILRDTLLGPDQVTFSSVLSACANLVEFKFGKQVHGIIFKHGLITLAYVKNSLMDMYCKCGLLDDAVKLFNTIGDRDVVTWNVITMGCVHNDNFGEACYYFWLMKKEDAYRVFDEIGDPNVVCWTAIIAACQQHGCANEVIGLFEKMIKEGITPEYITFISVLSACSHTGQVEDGFKYFNSMTEVHNVKPGPEHYACMVDLLGRVGRLDEANSFVESMPMKPDSSVWGALLGACRKYGNVEMGREVAERLFKLEPENSGNYALLSNLYTRYGMLEKADEVRRLMGINGVRKEHGCSWIDVQHMTFVFTVNDKSHSRTDEIYEMLWKLKDLIKKKGYVAETQFATNNVGGSEEQSLWYHSEKIALAFGLMALPVGAPIRIKKNLRTCGDCHTVMKFASEVFKREIIVRDINRFHRFTNGLCSCKDYW